MTLAGLRFPAIADIEDGTERHALRAQYTQSGSDFFMIACARSGKYSGVQAIGVGSNKDKREKACKVAFCLRALASTKDFAKCGDLALQPSVEKVQQLLAPFGATAPSSCNVASSVSHEGQSQPHHGRLQFNSFRRNLGNLEDGHHLEEILCYNYTV